MIRNWIELSQLYLTISLCSDSVSCIPPAWLAPHSATCARCAWQRGFRKAVLWGWRSTLLNLGWIQKGGVAVPGSKLRRAWIISRGGSYMSDKISPIPFSMLEITKLLNNSEPFLILQESFCNIKAVSDICQRTYLFPSSRKAPCCADIARGWLTLHTVGPGRGTLFLFISKPSRGTTQKGGCWTLAVFHMLGENPALRSSGICWLKRSPDWNPTFLYAVLNKTTVERVQKK